MSKIKLYQSVIVNTKNTTYFDILETVNELKSKIKNELRKEGLENEFEVIVDVKNNINTIEIND